MQLLGIQRIKQKQAKRLIPNYPILWSMNIEQNTISHHIILWSLLLTMLLPCWLLLLFSIVITARIWISLSVPNHLVFLVPHSTPTQKQFHGQNAIDFCCLLVIACVLCAVYVSIYALDLWWTKLRSVVWCTGLCMLGGFSNKLKLLALLRTSINIVAILLFLHLQFIEFIVIWIHKYTHLPAY